MALLDACTAVTVPEGWSREVREDCTVYYISPDKTVLRTRDEVLLYLTSAGTCKCGLRCPFQLDQSFSFDPEILSLPENADSSSLCKFPGRSCSHWTPRLPSAADNLAVHPLEGHCPSGKRIPSSYRNGGGTKLRNHRYSLRYGGSAEEPNQGIANGVEGEFRTHSSKGPFTSIENVRVKRDGATPSPVTNLSERFNSITRSHLDLVGLLQSVSSHLAPKEPKPSTLSTSGRSLKKSSVSGGGKKGRVAPPNKPCQLLSNVPEIRTVSTSLVPTSAPPPPISGSLPQEAAVNSEALPNSAKPVTLTMKELEVRLTSSGRGGWSNMGCTLADKTTHPVDKNALPKKLKDASIPLKEFHISLRDCSPKRLGAYKSPPKQGALNRSLSKRLRRHSVAHLELASVQELVRETELDLESSAPPQPEIPMPENEVSGVPIHCDEESSRVFSLKGALSGGGDGAAELPVQRDSSVAGARVSPPQQGVRRSETLLSPTRSKPSRVSEGIGEVIRDDRDISPTNSLPSRKPGHVTDDPSRKTALDGREVSPTFLLPSHEPGHVIGHSTAEDWLSCLEPGPVICVEGEEMSPTVTLPSSEPVLVTDSPSDNEARGLSPMVTLPNLEPGHVTSSPTDDAAGELSPMVTLPDIEPGHVTGSLPDNAAGELLPMVTLPNLELGHVTGSPSDDAVEEMLLPMATLPNLEPGHMTGSPTNDAAEEMLLPMATLPNLEPGHVTGSPPAEEMLLPMATLPNLEPGHVTDSAPDGAEGDGREFSPMDTLPGVEPGVVASDNEARDGRELPPMVTLPDVQPGHVTGSPTNDAAGELLPMVTLPDIEPGHVTDSPPDIAAGEVLPMVSRHNLEPGHVTGSPSDDAAGELSPMVTLPDVEPGHVTGSPTDAAEEISPLPDVEPGHVTDIPPDNAAGELPPMVTVPDIEPGHVTGPTDDAAGELPPVVTLPDIEPGHVTDSPSENEAGYGGRQLSSKGVLPNLEPGHVTDSPSDNVAGDGRELLSMDMLPNLEPAGVSSTSEADQGVADSPPDNMAGDGSELPPILSLEPGHVTDDLSSKMAGDDRAVSLTLTMPAEPCHVTESLSDNVAGDDRTLTVPAERGHVTDSLSDNVAGDDRTLIVPAERGHVTDSLSDNVAGEDRTLTVPAERGHVTDCLSDNVAGDVSPIALPSLEPGPVTGSVKTPAAVILPHNQGTGYDIDHIKTSLRGDNQVQSLASLGHVIESSFTKALDNDVGPRGVSLLPSHDPGHVIDHVTGQVVGGAVEEGGATDRGIDQVTVDPRGAWTEGGARLGPELLCQQTQAEEPGADGSSGSFDRVDEEDGENRSCSPEFSDSDGEYFSCDSEGEDAKWGVTPPAECVLDSAAEGFGAANSASLDSEKWEATPPSPECTLNAAGKGFDTVGSASCDSKCQGEVTSLEYADGAVERDSEADSLTVIPCQLRDAVKIERQSPPISNLSRTNFPQEETFFSCEVPGNFAEHRQAISPQVPVPAVSPLGIFQLDLLESFRLERVVCTSGQSAQREPEADSRGEEIRKELADGKPVCVEEEMEERNRTTNGLPGGACTNADDAIFAESNLPCASDVANPTAEKASDITGSVDSRLPTNAACVDRNNNQGIPLEEAQKGRAKKKKVPKRKLARKKVLKRKLVSAEHSDVESLASPGGIPEPPGSIPDPPGEPPGSIPDPPGSIPEPPGSDIPEPPGSIPEPPGSIKKPRAKRMKKVSPYPYFKDYPIRSRKSSSTSSCPEVTSTPMGSVHTDKPFVSNNDSKHTRKLPLVSDSVFSNKETFTLTGKSPSKRARKSPAVVDSTGGINDTGKSPAVIDSVGGTKHARKSLAVIDRTGSTKHARKSPAVVDRTGSTKHTRQSPVFVDSTVCINDSTGGTKHTRKSPAVVDSTGATKHTRQLPVFVDSTGATKHTGKSPAVIDSTGATKHIRKSPEVVDSADSATKQSRTVVDSVLAAEGATERTSKSPAIVDDVYSVEANPVPATKSPELNPSRPNRAWSGSVVDQSLSDRRGPKRRLSQSEAHSSGRTSKRLRSGSAVSEVLSNRNTPTGARSGCAVDGAQSSGRASKRLRSGSVADKPSPALRASTRHKGTPDNSDDSDEEEGGVACGNDTTFSRKYQRKSLQLDNDADADVFKAIEELDNRKGRRPELVVSIPFRIGKKVIAHHTLLNCAGQDTPSEKPSPSAYKVGDVIWARAPSLPAWPGKILSADDVGAARVPSDKVWVDWFGEPTHSLVSRSSIKDLREGVIKRLKLKPLSANLKRAVMQAIQTASKLVQ